MTQQRIHTDISNWEHLDEAVAEQIEKRDSLLDDLFLAQCRENQISYWPPRSLAGEYNFRFIFEILGYESIR